MRSQKINLAAVRIERKHVLGYASALTVERRDPSAVVANAKVLLDWMEVQDVADREVRYMALSRAHNNRDFTRKPDNAPEKLITEAEVFYAFLKAA
jgi:hypothetical protein